MKKAPPEVDRLMWAIAENATRHSIEEFGSRYPAYRLELMRRVNMVESLRTQMKSNRSGVRELPKFEPRADRSVPLRTYAFAGVLGIAAVAVASFAAISTAPTVKRHPEVPIARTETPIQPNVQYVNPPPFVPPVTQTNPTPQQAPTPEQPAPAYLQPRAKVALRDVNLTDALSLVTSGTGIHLEVGPGFPNVKVSMDYRDKNTVEILHDLAKQYAFTISDEGDGQYLVLPVPDSSGGLLSGGPLTAEENRSRIGP